MFSVLYEGKNQDMVHRRSPIKGVYNTYIGDTLICQIHKLGRSWSVIDWICNPKTQGLHRVDGFRTRDDCAVYILRLNKIWGD